MLFNSISWNLNDVNKHILLSIVCVVALAIPSLSRCGH